MSLNWTLTNKKALLLGKPKGDESLTFYVRKTKCKKHTFSSSRIFRALRPVNKLVENYSQICP